MHETSKPLDKRNQIIAALDHLDHVVPGQGPIHEFVHHNTIHGFQHLPFEKALEEFEAMTGIYGYLSESENKALYQQGRITDEDLSAALTHNKELKADQILYKKDDLTITRKNIYQIALLFDIKAITASQLNWQVEELQALSKTQADVSDQVKNQLLASGLTESEHISQLWKSILNKLGLKQSKIHPEDMLDLSVEQAENWLEKVRTSLENHDDNNISIHHKLRNKANTQLEEMLDQVGHSITLRGFIMALSGVDILDSIRPQLIRICASALDEGVAAWQLPDRSQLGLYAAWRATVLYDLNPFLHDLLDWQNIVSEAPEDAIDCIILQLKHMEIPEEKWEGYLRRLALELPGWSGLINWRQHHPNYHTDNNVSIQLADYLAIRLILDRLWLNQACQDNWKIEAKLGTLKHYFHGNFSEFMVRKQLYQSDLPEYLMHLAKELVQQSGSERQNRSEWQELADLMWTWQFSPMVENVTVFSLFNHGWRLFRLCQHLGLNSTHIQEIQPEDLVQMLTLLDEFTAPEHSKVWLYAYEYHYRENFFQSIRANYKRGRWAKRDVRPSSQVMFCIDEREESMRRHLEEINPTIETLGAAGFFGIPINYKGLDDIHRAALCPVVVTPAHDIDEIPRKDTEQAQRAHNKGHSLLKGFAYLMNQTLRRSLVFSHAAIDVLAPIVFINLLGRAFLPKYILAFNSALKQNIEKQVPTELLFKALDTEIAATPEHSQLGFTDTEQADRLTGFMRATGLTYGFAPIICLMAHGSTSQNNPHEAAHDCGACSGKRGGPNARLFAAMANRPEIRAILAERGIEIPDDSWFVGAEHDTCSDAVVWFDLEDIPKNLQTNFVAMKQDIIKSSYASAHERCRRFLSANNPKSPAAGICHVKNRSNDLSQVRPEYGHATNASAIVGRRSVSQGIFLDHRPFLISYDATQDPEGKLLENILLTVGPVGAGINLEYYFSTINNERFGCGTKIPHNITGMFGVMEGASSDIRTGLPKQMVEIHESIRLQILVEASTAVLGEIYGRQESIQELVGGGWVLLSAIDPESGKISVFERGVGFVPWEPEVKEIATYEASMAYYQDQNEPLPPVLIKQPNFSGAQ